MLKSLSTTTITLICLSFFSCVDPRSNTSKFLFDDNTQARSIKDSLIVFKELSIKVFESGLMNKEPMQNLYYLGISSDSTIRSNIENYGTWNDFSKNKEKIYQIRSLSVLKEPEKERLFSLLNYLNRYYINGITYYTEDQYAVFSYHEAPFYGTHNRFNKTIMLKSDFYALSHDMRTLKVSFNIITDEEEGMLLIMYDKGRYLTWVYGSEEEVPAKWKRPTDEVFKKE